MVKFPIDRAKSNITLPISLSHRDNKLDSITADDHTARNLSILCHDLPDRSRVEGLLGLNFVKVFEVSISYAKGYIEIGQLNPNNSGFIIGKCVRKLVYQLPIRLFFWQTKFCGTLV